MPVPAKRSGRTGRVTAILNVAAQRLNARGVSEEWFGDIAADLGITRPALYTHFDDRDELLFACYMRTIETLDAAFVDASRTDDAVATVDAFLAATINEAFPELAVVAEIDVLSEAKLRIVAGRWAELVDRIAQVVAEGVQRGQLRPFDPTIVARSILGLATWAPLQRRLLPDRPTAAVLSGAREILFHGMASDRSAQTDPAQGDSSAQAAPIDLFDRVSVAAAKRERLLGVASGLFNRRGVGATRMEEIAEAVGLNKRAIFRQFGSKDQLVAACFERANAIYLRIAAEAAAGRSRQLDTLHEAIRRAVLSMGDRTMPALTSHVGLGRLAETTQSEMRERFASLGEAYRTMLRRGMADGSIRSLPIDDVVAALAGNINWVASPDVTGCTLPLPRIATELAALTMFGILP